ncbi:MAG TPA: DUF1343 domain-containing protein [Chitinophagaceae bacterium]|nr:DUF1343 domain-containing protein [Chitinophagaceae bacterium]
MVTLLLAISNFTAEAQRPVTTGAERISVYLPLLKGKKVGVFANQTSMVGKTHLVDTLKKLGVNITVIFGPEHGFRGTADAGEKVTNQVDASTGIPIVSLYGSKRKPSADDLKNVDVLLFDIQDVGVRFYTYISSLQDYMETALENGIPLMILDRPNPNGFYVDGPVLDMKFKSFVGMQSIPIVYGMTIGEYAMMLGGEQMFSSKLANDRAKYNLTTEPTADTPFHTLVIKCQNYDHNTKYVLPVRPSPNLPGYESIYWYPSTCLFEGTVFSEGRGTEKPFVMFGHPDMPKTMYKFAPISREGAKEPKLKDKICYGWNLSCTKEDILKQVDGKIQLKYIIEAYKLFPDKENFFLKNNFFNRLAGNDILMQQIKDGKSEAEIRKSWEPDLKKFMEIRKKYLLYKDF